MNLTQHALLCNKEHWLQKCGQQRNKKMNFLIGFRRIELTIKALCPGSAQGKKKCLLRNSLTCKFQKIFFYYCYCSSC